MKFPKVRTFHIEEDRKKQAVKVLEEAAEFVEAAKAYETFDLDDGVGDFYRRRMMEEACDVLVSLANALELCGVEKDELKESMANVELKNYARGRYYED